MIFEVEPRWLAELDEPHFEPSAGYSSGVPPEVQLRLVQEPPASRPTAPAAERMIELAAEDRRDVLVLDARRYHSGRSRPAEPRRVRPACSRRGLQLK